MKKYRLLFPTDSDVPSVSRKTRHMSVRLATKREKIMIQLNEAQRKNRLWSSIEYSRESKKNGITKTKRKR